MSACIPFRRPHTLQFVYPLLRLLTSSVNFKSKPLQKDPLH